jgi:hypothetical protein
MVRNVLLCWFKTFVHFGRVLMSQTKILIFFRYIFKIEACITGKGYGTIWYIAWTKGI